MDKATVVKLIAGTLVRGLMWGAGLLAQAYSVQMPSEETWQALALFLAGLAVEGAAVAWSAYKNRKLANAPPPGPA